MRHYATWAFASTLALNRKYSVRAASRSQARRAQHRQARALTLPQLRRPPSVSLIPLHRRGKPTRWAGFPLGVFSEKASLLSHGEAPLRPASPSAFGLTPFPQSCHGFVLEAQTAPAPCFNQSLVVGGVTPPAQGSLVLANFAPEASPFSKSAKMPDLREPRTGSAPINSRFLAGGIS